MQYGWTCPFHGMIQINNVKPLSALPLFLLPALATLFPKQNMAEGGFIDVTDSKMHAFVEDMKITYTLAN